MDNNKTPKYYIEKIITDIEFCIRYLKNVAIDEFNNNELLTSAISFKFVQISENVKKLPQNIFIMYPNIPWMKISGLRNRIVHDYDGINLENIWYIISNDLEDLKSKLKIIVSEYKKKN